MAIRRHRNNISPSAISPELKAQRDRSRLKLRQHLLEVLENRHLMAVGPQLIGIQPNNSDLLEAGDVRQVAPRELVFRFDDSQVIDASTLSGIRISRSGGDGSFGLASAESDFGSVGRVNIQLTAKLPGNTYSVQVQRANLGAGVMPGINVAGGLVTLTLNSNATTPTTARQLVDTINNSAALASVIGASIHGGLETAVLGTINPASYSPIAVTATNDLVVTPGAVLVGQNPNENEVTLRFAEALSDDQYRIEIFGFDDPSRGIRGLRNVGTNGTQGNLFQPTQAGTRQDTIDFRLDLGAQVTAVVPQPVQRVGSQLQQLRDTIVVYFDNDKLLVENDAFGQPKPGSVENPQFYQLIYTDNTVRNTDDVYFFPTTVTYNATANTATLKFAGDINDLMGSGAGLATYRLRIGTRESAPIRPTYSEASATVISDLNTNGLARIRFTARQVGEAGNGIQVAFVKSATPTASVNVVGNVITIAMVDGTTAQNVIDLVRNSSAATALVSVQLEPDSIASTIVGDRNLAYSPLTLVGLGSSFDTAMDLGRIGSSTQQQTSIVLGSSIDPEAFTLDLQGASDDPAHRQLPQNVVNSFEDHINGNFTADNTNGITTIYYNFEGIFGRDNSNNLLANAISDVQKQRAREALALWSKYIGVQFVETSNLGLTIATGPLTGVRTTTPSTRIQLESGLGFGVRIDPTFNDPLIALSATYVWNDSYGESYFRAMVAAVGMVLGLEHAGDLPETTLMRLDPTFMSGSGTLINQNDAQLNASDEKYEPIFPGNQDVIHGQYLYRPDGSDIDLYRFEVDFGGEDRVGLLTAETYAQRLTNASALDTNLHLYKQIQAQAATSFGVGEALSLRFEAVRPGAQGNQLQVFFTQSNRGTSTPGVLVFPNAISIDLSNTAGSESTVADVISAIQSSTAASKLVKVQLERGLATTKVGANILTQNPVVLSGGKLELISKNDNYFSQDSVINFALGSGIYFIGVSASGNDDYNASIPGTGFGGHSQGEYQLRLSFRAQVDVTDTIRDIATSTDPSVGFDGDGDGIVGGTYNFWFETRPLDRVLSFNAGGSASLEGRVVTIVGANGITRDFEFTTDASIGAGRVAINYTVGSSQGQLANALASAINGRPELGVSAIANGARLRLQGERYVVVDPSLTLIDIEGKMIFVDKSAGPSADGSLAHPFNNISGTGVPNAFTAAHPGDIVRIVGNGGNDGDITTIGDNVAYEIGAGLLPGSVLSDGLNMEVPKGVTTQIDAGAIFKLQRARIGVGSSNLNVDRSGAALQVLGAPVLLDNAGNVRKLANGTIAAGSVYFTSWLDETIGLDTYAPRTTPVPGNWGGISFRRDVDVDAGRSDLEDEGIFIRYVNHADIRYGGGNVLVDSNQQTVNPIEMLDTRPTVTFNKITSSANAALSAFPNSFEETNFNEPRYQVNGSFTSDYDRVGPDIRRNTLLNNSINGLFIRVDTPVIGTTETLTVPGRFDDIDVTHVLTESLIVSGRPGGALLDTSVPPSDLVSTGPNVGGTLLPGTYNYKITFVDQNGYESVPSDPTVSQVLLANQTAISIAGLPAATGEFITRRLYRSNNVGSGPYELVANLDRATSTYLDTGDLLGGTITRDRADVSAVIASRVNGGTLAIGSYTYRVVMVDSAGREGLASNPTSAFSLTPAGSVRLDQLPLTLPGYVARRIYRSVNGGAYVRVAELLDSNAIGQTTYIDNGSTLGGSLSPETLGVKRPRINASLVIDPGTVLKLEASRIEATFGAHITAEGTDGLPIVFTSKLDDTVGAGGTFDTNNSGTSNAPAPRDWGGIYMAPTSTLSVDYARFTYAGGVTRLDGTFRAFNTIELQQADGRIAHSVFENNADGFGGQGPGTRFGRLSNSQSTIFVRGAQPTIIDNVFRNNIGKAITIDANSMVDDIQDDAGRQTGAADINTAYGANRGPLIRNNRMIGNSLNGLEIRGDTLTTASVWDDTDIVHVLYDGIFIENMQHEGGLRLQSAPNESLVVKFDGYGSNFNRNMGAGITTNGQMTVADDRVGGTLHVLGQPGFPVILTSLKDDTVGAGLQPNGAPQTDTNNDGIGSIPQSADWRGILIDQYSNDRNVAAILETESFTAAAPGPNGQVASAQVLGSLAPNASASSENLRLGFSVEGVLSQAEDVDVYSFTAEAGTQIWLDVDYTRTNLDLVLELLDANGALLARSDDSTAETQSPGLLTTTPLINASNVNPLPLRTSGVRTTSAGLVKEDGTVNPSDPGMRVLLPGNPGTRSTFYFRVRSAGSDITDVKSGLSSGSYQVQVRLREQQEYAGSTIDFADIRYAMNGVHLVGMPDSSPLIGEASEDESVRNGDQFANNGTAIGQTAVGNRPQYIGNILDTAKGAISVAGNLSSDTDVDFYQLRIEQKDLVGGLNGFAPVVFDIDYADGLNRPDTSINIFIEENSRFGIQYRLIYSGDGSNIADDQRKPLTTTDLSDFSRGSAGTRDGYIGPIALAEGNYVIGISSAGYQPRHKILNPFSVTPINSIRRIVDTTYVAGASTFQPPVITNFLPQTNVGGTGELVSAPFSLASYSAADLPAVYFNYTHGGGQFEIFVRDSAGTETRVASTQFPISNLSAGTNSFKIPLVNTLSGWNFSSQDNLRLVFRSVDPNTNINSLIIGFGERGEQIGAGDEPVLMNPTFLGISSVSSTRTFSLATYLVSEQPSAVFSYEVFNGELDIFLIDNFGFTRRLATSANDIQAGEVALVKGSPQQGRLDLSRWANQPGLRLEFRTRADNPTRVNVGEVTMVLADGSRINSREPNSTYAEVAVPSTTVKTGPYQLEVRLADNFFQSTGAAAPTLTKTWDTNDRLGEQISLIAPSGANISDGDTFAISDGGTRIVFEFSTDTSVGLGNVIIRYTAADPAYRIAQLIRDAINNPSVQSRLKVSAASSGGIETGTTSRDTRIHLFGNATFQSLQVAIPAGRIQSQVHSGSSDRNIARDQSQMLIQNSFIRESRDYGIWSEPARRLADPRDAVSFAEAQIMQSKPNLAGTQAVRNLLVPNDSVTGGLLPGLVIQNNVLEEGGLGGIHIQGESPIWEIAPRTIPTTDNSLATNVANTHFGGLVDDGDLLIVDSDRTRLNFEFEDIAGAPTGGPTFGSGVPHGDGYAASSSPIWYRDDAGATIYRIIGTNLTAIGTTALETMMAMRDSILGSILVSNGTTQQITATVAESTLGPVAGVSTQTIFGYANFYNRPALYLEGVTSVQTVDVGNGSPFTIRRLDLGEVPQPHARLVNNTIVGTDGRVSIDGAAAQQESNDTIATATQTWQGTSHNPLSYTTNGSIGDNATLVRNLSQDVDMFQFKLGVGDRVLIDVDAAAGSALDGYLQIFDSRGVPQSFRNTVGASAAFSDNEAAPGENQSFDPYIDFTATVPGVYYAALSSVGNTSFDPLSMANRGTGTTRGAYSIDISVRHPQEFTITAEDASQYNQGDTFTIFQIPDIVGQATSGRTFEFTFTGGVSNPGNIPIRLNANWYFPDVARAIAKAINEGLNGQPALSNAQSLPNGTFGNASPIPPVIAVPINGLAGIIDGNLNNVTGDLATVLDQFSAVDELGTNALSYREIERITGGPFRQVNQGLQQFTRRNDGVNPTHAGLGIGWDRGDTNAISNTSRGDGTTEKFVLIKNAAFIQSNGSIIVDPDANANNNLDQVIPETGILASRGASPTILNNVFFNIQTPIINEESRYFPLTGGVAPYGSNNPNLPSKPGEVVVGGSIYQYFETRSSRTRYATGIETSPTNVPNTSLDFNTIVPNGVKLFVNAQGSQYLPAAGSPIIDSSIDSMPERPRLAAVKGAVGIPVSPVLAPAYDLVGQLRVDDPDVAPPAGQGQNVFKDRGALDRADFVGPAAILLNPIDNDALGIDQDSADSVVQLNSGVYPEFRIQLADGNEPANPFKGVGIDDSSVTNSIIVDRRLTGAAVVVFEDGRVLQEGIDYSFAYNATRDEIILTPLAGVWKNDRVYEISLNNKDRFVISAPSGNQISDGDAFTITDSQGGLVQFEFDSGYRLQLPQGITIQVPIAGAGAGGIVDGDRFTIDDGTRSITFEMDLNNNFLAGNVPVPFAVVNTRQELAQRIANAIAGTALNVTPRVLAGGEVFLGAALGTKVTTSFSRLTQPESTLGLQVPSLGARPGGVTDGQVFSISDGLTTVIFEIDTDNVWSPANNRIDTSSAITANDIATLIIASIKASPLKITPSLVGNDTVYLGLSSVGGVSAQTSRLNVVGVSRSIVDGQSFSITLGGTTKVFEFSTDANLQPGNILIPFAIQDTEDEIGLRVAGAVSAANIGMTPVHVRDGNIALGGTPQHQVSVLNAPTVDLFGKPGVQTNSTLEIIGSLVLRVPTRGGLDLPENGTFSITNNNRTVTFEFDGNFSGPSLPGNVVIPFSLNSSANDVANLIASAVTSAGLGINASNIGGGRVDIGLLADSQVRLFGSTLTSERGNVGDGEWFSINNGTTTVTFEFENVSIGNGFVSGRTPILFSNSSTRTDVITAMKAAIEASSLGLATQVIGTTSLRLLATPSYTIDTTSAPSIDHTGVPGGANAIVFSQDITFSAEQVAQSIVQAINSAQNTSLQGKIRGGNTVFVENAVSVSSEIANYFIRAIEDLAGNDLKPNRINNETQFTILMPGVELDYGDAPDPVSTTQGRYPTLKDNNGARHVVTSTGPMLGSGIDSDIDGRPTPNADGDLFDDGVIFTSSRNPTGLFNKLVTTDITVTASGAGYVDGWIDFNADGDWDDPNEKIIDSVRFLPGALTQTFAVTIPASAPAPLGVTKSFARFRVSSAGGLQPTGLAVDGEVQDYAVTLVPGTPPVAVDDSYDINEDSLPLVTTDILGLDTPSFRIDDGVAANDIDPEGGPYTVTIVSGPTHASSFLLNPDGTFIYTPSADFFGTDTFTYRISDGLLTSNNIGTATIVVREVNDTPIGGNDTITLSEDEILNINESVLLANDAAGPSTESGQTIRIAAVSPVSAQGGSVSLVNGIVRYVPRPDYAGPDSFTYILIDNGTTAGLPDPLTAVVTVALNVQNANDPPVAGADSTTTVEDTAKVIDQSVLLSNDSPGPSNESSQLIRFVGVNPTSTNGGTVVVSGSSVIYTPAADFSGVDTFTYTIEDNGTPIPMQSSGTVTVTVTPVNDAPRVIAPMGTQTMLEDAADRIIDLATVFRDPDVQFEGDTTTYSIVSNSNTSLVQTILSNGRMTLRLNPDQNGTASVVVRAQDASGQFVTNSLTLNVTPVADAPRVLNPIPDQTVNEDAATFELAVIPANLFDPDVATNGDTLTLSLISNSNSSLVQVTVVGDKLRFEFAANQSGRATISVRATDASGASVSDTFDVIVNPVNDGPTTTNDVYTVQQGGLLRTTDSTGRATSAVNDNGVLANDTDVEGNAFTAQIVSNPTRGTVVLASDGTFVYTPTTAVAGQTDTFTYQAVDAGGAVSRVTTVTISIGNPAPPRHQNPVQHMDVNADGFVSPIDVLLVINFLNLNGPSTPVNTLQDPPPYRDASGDNFITSLDALMVINYLNLNGNGRSGGEGEGEELGDSELVLSWQSVVSRPDDNAVVMMERTTVSGSKTYGPTQSVGASMMDLAEYLIDWDVVDDLADRLAVTEDDDAGLVDDALLALLGMQDDEESRA